MNKFAETPNGDGYYTVVSIPVIISKKELELNESEWATLRKGILDNVRDLSFDMLVEAIDELRVENATLSS